MKDPVTMLNLAGTARAISMPCLMGKVKSNQGGICSKERAPPVTQH